MSQPAAESPFISRSRIFARLASILAVVVGALVLTGWILDVADFKSIYADITMKPNTAVCLTLTGAALWFLVTRKRSVRLLGQICAASAALIGLLTLSQHVLGWDLHIDQLLFTEPPGALATYSPGRMGITASSSFLMFGTALLLLYRRKAVSFAQFLALTAGLWALLSIIGYAYQAEQLFAMRYSGIALHTAITLLALSLGIIASSIGSGFSSIISEDSVAGWMVRRSVVIAVLVPFVLGLLLLAGQRAGHFDFGLGTALLVIAIILIFLLAMWWVARRLGSIEQQRLASETIAEAGKERLRRQTALIDLSYEPILVWQFDGPIIEWNKGCENLYGHARQEAVGRVSHELLKTELPVSLDEYRADLERNGFWSGELRHFTHDGRQVLIETRQQLIESQGQRLVLETNRDITERKRVEEQLRESEARTIAEANALARLNELSSSLWQIQTLNDGLGSMLDATMELLNADKGNVQIFDEESRVLRILSQRGFDAEFLELFREVSTDDDTACGRALRTGERVVIEDVESEDSYAPFRPIARAADYRAVQSTPLIGRNGTPLGMLSTHFRSVHRPSEQDLRRLDLYIRQAADFIERCRTEQQLEKLLEREKRMRAAAEGANRIKDEFLATVSHELRTPLNAILGWATMIRNGKLDASTAARAIETIERNAKSQAQLIEDLLDVSRIISGKMRLDIKPILLTSIVKSAMDSIRPAAEAKNIRFELVIDPRADRMRADEARIQQIIWNLLSNSVKFTPAGGSVQIRISCNDSTTELAISDTGEGISAEFLPHVFNRFEQADGSRTRRHGGLGLGLAITRHLVEMHGGTIVAESDGIGLGSTFTIKMPVAAVTNAAANDLPITKTLDPSEPEPPNLAGLKILAIDDLHDARELLRTVLEQYGADVTTASSAREGLQVIAGWRPSLIVCDIGMPDEDGYSFIRKVRGLDPERGGKTPAIALTGYVRVEDRMFALEAGYQMFVPKPVEAIELGKIVATLVGKADSDP